MSETPFNNAGVIFNRAAAHQNEKEWGEAAKLWIEFIELKPNEATGYLNFAFSMMQLRRYEEAFNMLKRASKLFPQDPTLGQQLTFLTQYLKVDTDSFLIPKDDVDALDIYDRKEPYAISCLARLKDMGFTPKGVIDIGAHQGDWVKDLKIIFPEVPVLMIDANPDNAAKLLEATNKYADSKYRIQLVGKEDKEEVDFYVTEGNATGSSIYEENTNAKKHVVKMRMQTLDTLLKEVSGDFNFLKLDVQGAERDILEGAGDSLSRFEMIFAEVSILPYNKGAPLITEMLSFMDTLGFMPIDIVQIERFIHPFPVQADILFVRKDSQWVPRDFEFPPSSI